MELCNEGPVTVELTARPAARRPRARALGVPWVGLGVLLARRLGARRVAGQRPGRRAPWPAPPRPLQGLRLA